MSYALKIHGGSSDHSDDFDMTPYIALDGYQVSVQDVDFEAGRMADGTMKRNRVARKRKIAVTFRAGLTNAQIRAIHSKVTAQSFKAHYLDPTQADGYGTGEFYVGDRTFPRHSNALVNASSPKSGGKHESGLWSSWTMDFVEM